MSMEPFRTLIEQQIPMRTKDPHFLMYKIGLLPSSWSETVGFPVFVLCVYLDGFLHNSFYTFTYSLLLGH